MIKCTTHVVHRLNKLANMGSGICFPMLALVVYIAAVTAVRVKLGITLREAGKLVYVYGDDLIVPAETANAVTKSLEKYGLAVNTDKSYSTGFFRESCGADYYHGTSVAPVRFKMSGESLGTVRQYRNGFLPITSDNGILQMERHCRELVDNGLTKTSAYYYSLLKRRLGILPIVARDSPALGEYNPLVNPVDKPVEAYVSTPVKVLTPQACGHRGLGRAFSVPFGLGDDFLLTPLRRSIKLQRRVLEGAQICCYGIVTDPREAFDLRSGHQFYRESDRIGSCREDKEYYFSPLQDSIV